MDNLTARLHPDSGPFFPDLWIEDRVDLPDGGNITLASGLGIRCEGNASALVESGATGWVACSLRLASDPAAMVTSTRQLELGFDYQPLTRRMPAEPVEWRVVIDVVEHDAALNASVLRSAFDSGWRAVDLTAKVTPPTVSLHVLDACDAPDDLEAGPGLVKQGRVLLNVTFSVLSHAQVNITVGLQGSVSGGAPASFPYAPGTTTEHGATGAFPSWGSTTAMLFSLPVDLETDALPGSSTGGSPCEPALAHERQTWTVTMDYRGADGRGGRHVLEVPYDVYVGAP